MPFVSKCYVTENRFKNLDCGMPRHIVTIGIGTIYLLSPSIYTDITQDTI
jgi:hypothetical protein